MPGTLYITGDQHADALLNDDANALLLGMLLDQQVPMEWAFAGPATLRERLGHLDPAKIASMDVDEFVAVCVEKPAIHRFPGSMGQRIHAVCNALVEDWMGLAAQLWADAPSAATLSKRLRA
ncbi:MAG: HhH-GPD-type base excision DNA repair protein, partial [Actinomycetota bacterium]